MPPRHIEDLYRLSPLQEGMLFESRLRPGSGLYVIQLGWRLEGDLDLGALLHACRRVVERHPPLRTSFHWRDLDHPLQAVHQRVRPPLSVEDWRRLAAGDQERLLAARLAADRRRGFDLERPPLLRVVLIRLAERRYHLLWSHHHLLLDGWSEPLVLEELFVLYAAFRRGREADLPRRRPYRDYIDWLRGRDRGSQEDYWRRTLGGFTTPTPLGLDGGERPAAGEAPVPDQADCDGRLDAAVTAALVAFARRQRLTPATLVHGAWALLLARYGGNDDLVFGTVVSGRPPALAGAESMVGLFINTLPLRVRTPPAQELGEWLAALQAAQLEMRQHEHTPLVDVHAWSEVAPGVPLFETLVVFENYPLPALGDAIDGLAIRGAGSREQDAYPLSLAAAPGEELTFRLAYDPRRLERTAARRLLGHLATLLRGIAADPCRRLGELPLLTAGERQQLVAEWSAGALPPAGAATLHGLVARSAAATPEAVAVVFPDRELALTYGELDRRAERLARRLRRKGVGAEAVVALRLPRSPELLVGMLATLKAGGAFLPLDPGDPPERLAFLLKDSGARLVLGGEEVAVPGSGDSGPVRETPGGGRRAGGFAGEPHPGHLAYLIYTSGSTGRPKGVAVGHGAVAAHLRAVPAAYRFGAGSRTLLASSPGFDAAVEEIFAALGAGATLVVLGPGVRCEAELLRLLQLHGVAVATLTPAYFGRLAEAAAADAASAGALELLSVGGEALAPGTVKAWRRSPLRTARLDNAYGPTEAVITATVDHVVAGEAAAPRVPIGRPLPGRQAFVLDRRLEPLPVGIAGELALGGLLARGYLGGPGATARRFVPHPWGDGERLYLTGDRVRWLPDGRLDFLGRLDRQVKVRGFRIELGEVEATLAAHPAIREAAVEVEGGGPVGERLVAYVAVRDPQVGLPEAATLRRDLAAWLPEAMVPSFFVPLAELPRTASGKVDRRALPAPEPEAARRPYAVPRSPLEELLAAVFSQVLGVSRVGIEDDFFALGGHSLLATQVVSRVRASLGVELPLAAFFAAPTVAALAAAVAAARQAGQGIEAAAIVPAPRSGPLPLSFAQERLWFMERMDPGTSTYHMPASVRLAGRLAPRALRAALTEIVRRHGVLRTVFAVRRGEPEQIVQPAAVCPLPVIDLSGVGGAERLARELAAREAERRFDLERGPPLRAVLVRRAADDHLFLLTQHHIVSDGWSCDLLFGELVALYPAFAAGRPSPLPELPLQYADFAVWQRGWLAGDLLERQLAYWRRQLGGAPELLALPTDRPRPAAATPQGRKLPLALDAGLVDRLRGLGEARGATLFMTLLAAFAALLHRTTGETDLVLGSLVANRNREEVEPLIGFFVNTLALRLDLAGGPSFEALLAQARRVALEAYDHQDLPFEKLVAELRPRRSRSHSPLFQVMFDLQAAPPAPPEIPGLTFEPLAGSDPTARFDLTLALAETGAGLSGILGYRTELFDPTTVERLAAHFRRLLAAIAADPAAAVRDLPLLSPAEAHQLTREWSAAESRPVPGGEPSVSRRFEAQARRAPESVALVAGDVHLTYRELDARAAALAARLRRRGVGGEVLVGISLPRSPETVVAVLAVLKAGGAYLPLDPAYPAPRLALMVDDARPAAIVTGGGAPAFLAAVAAAARPEVVDLAAGSGDVGVDAPRPAAALAPGALAYVIYTSGSTGRPKGVAVPHAELAARLEGLAQLFAFGPGDRQLGVGSLSFDVSCEEIFLPLTTGATLVLADGEAAGRPAAMLADCARRAVTKLTLTASHWHQIAATAAEARPLAASLRLLLTGAESPSPERFAELAHRAPAGARWYNLYGPTEAVISASSQLLPRAPEDLRALPRIAAGRPLPGARIELLDAAGRPAPAGVGGEVHLGGAGLARGYLGRAALTADRFRPDPWSGVPGARLYRTGDRGRWLADGRLELLGRCDDQVKVRGFRVEPAEIEAALGEHPAVGEVAVALRDGEGADAYLVAYLAAPPQKRPSVRELRRHLAARLPEFMLPARFVFLAELPRTPSGKLDRGALPAPGAARPDLGTAYAPPASPLERHLAELWRDLLGLERVGRDDNFFDLGGDSIKGALMIQRLEAELGEHVWVTALFDTASLAELAEYLAAHYPARVGERFGAEPEAPPTAGGSPAVVDRATVDAFRSLIERRTPFEPGPAEPCPPAVFILSPPRSGSTLLRVMLGGHPRLFAPPELELLSFDTLGERRRALSGRYAFWREGLLRAVMEARGCSAGEARRLVATQEDRDQPVAAAYRLLQGSIGGRMLVDKTPAYALDPEALERAERGFSGARYLHLLRHPGAAIRSFEKARLDEVFFRRRHPFSRRQLAELIWVVSHRNILAFLAAVPAERRLAVRFEELVRRPRPVMEEICRFLELPFDEGTLEPYAEKGRRMTDGVHPLAKMLGDVEFHRHREIDAATAERWRREFDAATLGGPARRLALALGYADVAGRGELPPCLVALAPGAPRPPLFVVHPISGEVFSLRHLAAALGGARPVWGLQAVDPDGRRPPPESLEALAARYVDAVTRVAPDGPYLLAGSSMGGAVAYEMARQLNAAGRPVALVALLDSADPGPLPAAGPLEPEAALLAQLAGLPDDADARRLLAELPSREERLEYVLGAAARAGSLPPGVGRDQLRHLVAVAEANRRALAAYRPGPYPGRLLHLRAADGGGPRPEASGWAPLAGGGVELVVLPGDHLSLLRPPHVTAVAQRLASALREAETQAAGAAAG